MVRSQASPLMNILRRHPAGPPPRGRASHELPLKSRAGPRCKGPPGQRSSTRSLCSEQLGLALIAERGHELLEIPLDHLIELVEREPDAVIGDAVLLEVIGP